MDLSRRYRVSGVPKTVVNDVIEVMGGLPEADFVEAVLQRPGRRSRRPALQSRRVAELCTVGRLF